MKYLLLLVLAISVASTWGHRRRCGWRRRHHGRRAHHWGRKAHWGRGHHWGRRHWRGRGRVNNSSAHGSAHHGYAASKAGKHGAASFGAGHGVRTGA